MKKKRAERPASENHGLLYGVNPLLEALRAGDRIPDEVVIAEGARDHRLHELIELARNQHSRQASAASCFGSCRG